MKVSALTEWEYTPSWGDNREEDEPVVIVCQPLTSEQRTRCLSYRYSANGEVEIDPDYARFFRYGVKEVRNLEDNHGALRTAADVLKSTAVGIDNLIREVGTEIFIAHMVDKKK